MQVVNAIRNPLLPFWILTLSLYQTVAGQNETDAPYQQPSGAKSSPSSSKTAGVSINGCLTKESGMLKLTDEDGNIYKLAGNTKELTKHIGDELIITGTEEHPPTPTNEHAPPETILNVKSLKEVFHPNSAGVHPLLGDNADWSDYTDDTYGIHYPRTFSNPNQPDTSISANFVDPNGTLTIKSLEIPTDTYPNANFERGRFTVFVHPGIHNEGSCNQFSSFLPEYTSSHTVHGIKYAQTEGDGVAAGTALDTYYLHHYRNDVCYEFVFDFFLETGSGIPLTCSVQRLTQRNMLEILDTVLSTISFTKPAFKSATVEKSGRTLPPTVERFEYFLTNRTQLITVHVSWSTRAADYVQLHYDCMEGLRVSEVQGGTLNCGNVTERNFPPNGSAEFFVDNRNRSPVPLVLSIQPFAAGVGYPKQSKSIEIQVNPMRR